MLQSKNVNIETIGEYIRVSEKLNEYNLSFQDIDKCSGKCKGKWF